MPAGGVLVQHTTCDPATMTLLAETGAQQGIAVLDAALSGTPRDIADGLALPCGWAVTRVLSPASARCLTATPLQSCSLVP